ncbi:hypothetical protein C1645_829890 [Glomus cerebriforme]|uniref:Uncharacterized protein n=1 Tax=Glomus cerebriforme TaxID=658196 RepID=A0A397SN45_9GLOM|nr:hypothetical protein C1645_829890 [Glomus cerebriforme]
MASSFLQLTHTLLEPIPQYVLGCLPAIAIIGASPMNKFTEKLAWILRCLGCPFIGLFYALNIGGKKESRCIYWLSSDYFAIIGDEETTGNIKLKYRPFGFYTMLLNRDQNYDLKTYVDRCTAKISVLERLSSLVSAYYIVVGIMAGISMVTGSVVCVSWPYIPLLLSWTIPALCRRGFSGNLVVKDPNIEFNNVQIIMDVNQSVRIHKRFTVTVTAFISIVYPWITVLLAYFTPPIGYFCRSKFITIFCVIWSFNSVLAYLCHWKGERNLFGKWYIHAWFSLCGLIVAILLFGLGLFTKNNQWWVDAFGNSCSISSIGCV